MAALVLVCSLELCNAGAGTQPTQPSPQQFSDFSNTFVITADPVWKQVESDKHSRVGFVLGIRVEDLSTLAVITVWKGDHTEDLEKRAKWLMDDAKKQVPDQGNDSSITSAKVDGEEARIVQYRRYLGHTTIYIVNHATHEYEIKCECRDHGREAAEALVKPVIESFSWTKKE
jgi:hypothetical protein